MMRLADVIALTGAKQRTIYSWMAKHPTVAQQDPESPLGHPFPKPVGKEGREVVWESAQVKNWWMANRDTLGRHTEPSIIMSEMQFIQAMQEQIDDVRQDQATGAMVPEHPFGAIERVERLGPGKLKLTFRDVGEAIRFKWRWAC